MHKMLCLVVGMYGSRRVSFEATFLFFYNASTRLPPPTSSRRPAHEQPTAKPSQQPQPPHVAHLTERRVRLVEGLEQVNQLCARLLLLRRRDDTAARRDGARRRQCFEPRGDAAKSTGPPSLTS